jgi:hypothetical protein
MYDLKLTISDLSLQIGEIGGISGRRVDYRFVLFGRAYTICITLMFRIANAASQ